MLQKCCRVCQGMPIIVSNLARLHVWGHSDPMRKSRKKFIFSSLSSPGNQSLTKRIKEVKLNVTNQLLGVFKGMQL